MPFDPNPTDAAALLARCPAYRRTPLHTLDALATEGGWAACYLKDETARMGLGSFKALGGVYAVANLLRDQVGSEADLLGEAARMTAAGLTVCCASAGNHGLSVAAGAAIFGARAVIYLAETVPETFADRLRAKGAKIVRAGSVYEDAMARAMRDAEANGWSLVSDSSWEGYRDVPQVIMRGYCVMAQEMAETFRADGSWPTHVFLQAGVGGLAAAISAHIRTEWNEQPMIVVVEPDRAPCLKASAAAGRPTRANGPVSNMGRLDCKDPSQVALEILADVADTFVTVSDEVAAEAVAAFARHGIQTTPSGAAGLAAALDADLSVDARILLIATEGRA